MFDELTGSGQAQARLAAIHAASIKATKLLLLAAGVSNSKRATGEQTTSFAKTNFNPILTRMSVLESAAHASGHAAALPVSVAIAWRPDTMSGSRCCSVRSTITAPPDESADSARRQRACPSQRAAHWYCNVAHLRCAPTLFGGQPVNYRMVKICYCERQCRHKEEQGKTMLPCCYKGIRIKLSVMCKKGCTSIYRVVSVTFICRAGVEGGRVTPHTPSPQPDRTWRTSCAPRNAQPPGHGRPTAAPAAPRKRSGGAA